MTSFRYAALSILLFGSASLSAPASAQVNVAEPPDLANTVGGASTITLGAGANSVSGSLSTPGDGQDNFLVAVPAGHRLTAASLTLSTTGGFVGSVTFNLSEVRTSSGAFTMGFPHGAGSYYVQVISDYAIGNAWSMSFTVAPTTSAPVCGNGVAEAGEACDDGNSTQCDGCSTSCTTVLNGCFIGGSCVADGTLSPSNPCTACRRTVSRTTYSPVLSGTACNDGSYCTVSDACNGAGGCFGGARDCGDGLSCTTDMCDEGSDSCTHPVTSGCLIAGACVAEGSADPGNECLACQRVVSSNAYSPKPADITCDDGAFCTADDVCDGAGACAGAARECDDGDECTTDACDESTDACTTTPVPACEMPDGGTDAGMTDDAGASDAGAPVDAGAEVDAGASPDAGSSAVDASTADAGTADAGVDPEPVAGCGCRAGGSPSSGWALLPLAFALWRGARRRRGPLPR